MAQTNSGVGKGGEAMVFVGTHERSLDDKGRLVLPARFRAAFSEHAFLSPAEHYVAMHTETGYNEMVERFREQVNAGALGLNLLRRVGTATEDARVDAQGRVGLSLRLRNKAALGNEVVVCGVIDYIEIWNAADWNPESDRSLIESFWRGGGI